MRLALGTAQFGLSYGVANRVGQVSQSSISEMLKLARANGVDVLDTAVAYGDSEQRLGMAGVDAWKVVTKLPSLPGLDVPLLPWAENLVLASLQHLKVPQLYGLLMHRSASFLDTRGRELYNALLRLKELGLVEKIGVSIYDPLELNTLLPTYDFDLIQAPFNIFDIRLQSSGWLNRLKDLGAEVHTRSAFLQGLLMMSADQRPQYFNKWQHVLNKWDLWVAECGVTALSACLDFVLSNPEIDRVVVGVDSVEQFQQLLASVGKCKPYEFPRLGCEDLDLIDPSRWRIA